MWVNKQPAYSKYDSDRSAMLVPVSWGPGDEAVLRQAQHIFLKNIMMNGF